MRRSANQSRPLPLWSENADVDTPRRRYESLHSLLRDEGHNPLEAVSLVASVLASNGEVPEVQLSNELRCALSAIAAESSAADASVGFQQFLMSESRNGLGQYLTPLPVAALIAAVVGSEKPRVVLDPFAGSGLLLERIGECLQEVELLGFEINPAIAKVTEAVSRLGRHPIRVIEGDAFSQWTSGQLPTVDAVVTNPPFGAMASRVSESELIRINAPEELLRLSNRPAELFGLELSVAALRDGGLLVIVLPQSVLTNHRWADYRKSLFQRIQLRSVVSLPEETFGPFKGVAKACMLVATKGSSRLPTSFPYFRPTSVGYDDTGRPNGNADLQDFERPLTDGDASGPLASIGADGQFLMPNEVGELLAEGYYRLGDFAEVFTGRTPPRGDHVKVGPHQLNVGGLSGSFISWRPRSRSLVSAEFYKRNPRTHLQVHDICLTAAAHRPKYIGLKVDLIDQLPANGAMASAEVLVIRLKPDVPFSAVQLLYYLRSEPGYRKLQELVRGSTAHLYPRDVMNLLIPPFRNCADECAAIETFWQAAFHFREYLQLESTLPALLGVRESPQSVDIS